MVIHYSGSYYRCKSDIMHLQITVVKSINKGVYKLFISGLFSDKSCCMIIKAYKQKLKMLASRSLSCPAQGNHGRFLAGKTARVTATSSVCCGCCPIFYSTKPSQGLGCLTSCGAHDAYYCSQIDKENLAFLKWKCYMWE